MADIFISYTSSDSDWAKWLHKELLALGHTPHIHEFEIGPGESVYAWMEERHDKADHVLCVISDAYLDKVKAPYSAVERDAALWQAAAKRPGFVLPVVVAPCRLPTLSDHVRRCEVHGVPEQVAKDRFRDFLARRGAANDAVFPSKVAAVSNIPIRLPEHFLGRDDALDAIEKGLSRYEGRVAITALHGLRGAGKTTLAVAYADRKRAEYRATWWIRAQTPEGMRADLVSLGVRLGWVAADAQGEPVLASIMERLVNEGDGILLIYDNAIDSVALRPFLPKGGKARILVTSNFHAWRGMAEPVEIRLWPTQIGADYLVARTGRASEREAAEKLSDALGGLPLAHEQAAAYCERLSVSLPDYLKRFEAQPLKLLDDRRHAVAEYGESHGIAVDAKDDALTVARTFSLAIAEASKLHPAAETLLAYAAVLAPEPIPNFLFADGAAELDEPLRSILADDNLEEAIATLATFALVRPELISDKSYSALAIKCFRVHRLVAHVSNKILIHAKNTANMFKSYFPQEIYDNDEMQVKSRVLFPHLLHLANITNDIDLIACLSRYEIQVKGVYYGEFFERVDDRLTHRQLASGNRKGDEVATRELMKVLSLSASRKLEKYNAKEFWSRNRDALHLSDLHQERFQFNEARSVYDKALDNFKDIGKQESVHAYDILLRIAKIDLIEFAAAHALARGQRCLAVFDSKLGRRHFLTRRAAEVVVEALSALDRHEEAAAILSSHGVGK